jgi:DNA helicase II / ATP-dependent DNA helicase PcrA
VALRRRAARRGVEATVSRVARRGYNRRVLDPEVLLAGLNPPQRHAVTHESGPLLVLAGAGSGKTRVIAHRIAYLIGVRGVDSRHVLAVTFTNKAAGEMARRVDNLLAPIGVRAPIVATFHSACVRILRQNIQHLGYKPHFTIYDEDDRLALVKECARERGFADERSLTASAIVSRISAAKNQMMSVDEMAKAARGPRDMEVAAIYKRYQERLAATGAVDFDDLLLLVVRLFQEAPNVLEWYRGLWHHVLVDEYQDTNRVQYRMIRHLTSQHRNICVVGDPDQSVYRWRGADIANILDFEKDYTGTTVVRLEQNYRSTQRVLALAAGVIAHNTQRKDKTLWTENLEGEPARVYRAWDEHEEANWVAQSLVQARGEGAAYSDIALFYRTNAQSRVLEDALRRAGIPYVIVGSVRFYERKEVKDVLAYLRLIVNANDDVAFRRAIGVPTRGIGRTSLDRLDAVAAREERSLLDLAATPPADIGGKQRRGLEEFAALIARLRTERAGAPLPAFVDLVLDATGYKATLEQERSPEAQARLENLEELVAAAEDHERTQADPSLESFLDSVALVSDADEIPDEARGVTMMTLHSAKGLEFDRVFMTGLEEGVFPHMRSLDDPAQIEEERRLCYVGITRARKKLALSWALHRRLHGYGVGEPSRFLREMPEQHLEMVNAHRAAPVFEASVSPYRASPGVSYGGPSGAPLPMPNQDDLPLRVNAKVRHARFGEGLVVGVEREGEDVMVTVRFASVGRKRLSLQYAHLEELD